ncbi:syd-1 [Cordylochernes scorpioides]|uniref:Syd-1 n=1 Tax=Cordylochernes scorpioides TaxID=51811 RepID=A0ABY6KEF5_9ARAC|nr:syd-1 [Cordylochernes scorpioides]
MDKVFLHHDKASSHTSNKTQQFLQEMKDTLGLNFIRNSDIPVKSPDASPLDFYGFGMLKQRLFNRRPETEAELWKAAQEEWSNVSLSKVKEVFAAWKVRCREIAKKKGKHIEHMKKIHTREVETQATHEDGFRRAGPSRPRGLAPEMVVQSDFRKVSGISSEVFRQLEVLERGYADLDLVERRGEMVLRPLDPSSLGRVAAEACRRLNRQADGFVSYVEIIKRPGQTLGLYIREGDGLTTGDGVFISRIALESAVYSSGLLKVGDEILAVNLVNVQRMSLDDVVIIMSIPRRLVLTIRSRARGMKPAPAVLERMGGDRRPPVVVVKKVEEDPRHDDWGDVRVDMQPWTRVAERPRNVVVAQPVSRYYGHPSQLEALNEHMFYSEFQNKGMMPPMPPQQMMVSAEPRRRLPFSTSYNVIQQPVAQREQQRRRGQWGPGWDDIGGTLGRPTGPRRAESEHGIATLGRRGFGGSTMSLVSAAGSRPPPRYEEVLRRRLHDAGGGSLSDTETEAWRGPAARRRGSLVGGAHSLPRRPPPHLRNLLPPDDDSDGAASAPELPASRPRRGRWSVYHWFNIQHKFKFNSTENLFDFACRTLEAILADSSLDSPSKKNMATRGLLLSVAQKAELLLEDAFKGASYSRPQPTESAPSPSTSFASVVAVEAKPGMTAPPITNSKPAFVNLAPSFKSHVVVRSVDPKANPRDILKEIQKADPSLTTSKDMVASINSSGKVVLHTSTDEVAKNLASKLATLPSSLSCHERPTILPRYCLFSVDNNVSDEEICTGLSSNHAIQSLPGLRSIKVVHRSGNNAWGAATVFVEVDNKVAEILGQQGRIPIAGLMHRFERSHSLKQCFRCCGFGHRAPYCTAAHPTCYKCGSTEHEGKQCAVEASQARCSKKAGAAINHLATSSLCPFVKAKIAQSKNHV